MPCRIKTKLFLHDFGLCIDKSIELLADNLGHLRIHVYHVLHGEPGIRHFLSHFMADQEAAHAQNIGVVDLPCSAGLIYALN